MSERQYRGAISLLDVEQYVRWIQNEYHCDAHFRMSIPVGQATAVTFWVALRAEPRIIGRLTIRAPVAVQLRWPHTDHKTLAGLMYHLCHELDQKLEKHGQLPAEQATFAWAED